MDIDTRMRSVVADALNEYFSQNLTSLSEEEKDSLLALFDDEIDIERKENVVFVKFREDQ